MQFCVNFKIQKMAAKKKNEENDLTKEQPELNPENVSETKTQQKLETTEIQSRQISELRDLTTSLMETMGNLQKENAQNLAYFDALSDIKAATKALIVTQAIPQKDGKDKRDPDIDKDCVSPCECVSDTCCSFDIMMTEVRVSSMQNEPGDSNLGAMEIRIYAHIEGVGAVIPGMFSTLSLHKPIGNPALWTTVNTKIKEVTVPKNTNKDFTIKVQGKEVEQTILENLLYLRDEHGAGKGTLTLNCCCMAPEITIEVPFTAGGLGLGNRGSIEVRFSAVKKCN